MSESMIERVVKALDHVVFQVGGLHGMRWQIIWQFAEPDFSDRVMFVGPEYVAGKDDLRNPNADMIFEMKRCKARAAIEAMREPTDGMVSKGTVAITLAKNAAHGPEPSAVLKGGTALAWQVMIDDALSEKP